eukprot:gene39302-53127_t
MVIARRVHGDQAHGRQQEQGKGQRPVKTHEHRPQPLPEGRPLEDHTHRLAPAGAGAGLTTGIRRAGRTAVGAAAEAAGSGDITATGTE